jgi:hypothetical protein
MEASGTMRRQYHFWPGRNGLDAWDVERVIEMAAPLAVEEVELASISEIDSVYWFAEGFPPPTVREIIEHVRLMATVDTSDPVILGPDGRVMDGMHRIARALLENRRTIQARRFERLPEPDYRDCRPEELPY